MIIIIEYYQIIEGGNTSLCLVSHWSVQGNHLLEAFHQLYSISETNNVTA